MAIGLSVDSQINDSDLFYYQQNSKFELNKFERDTIKSASKSYANSFSANNKVLIPPPVSVDYTDDELNEISRQMRARRKNNG